MFDTELDQIKNFLFQNFAPGTLTNFEFYYNNQQILSHIQEVFPQNSIDDFDLTEILTSLGFKRHVITEDNVKFLSFLKKLREQISDDYLKDFDLFDDLLELENEIALPSNTFCWLFVKK